MNSTERDLPEDKLRAWAGNPHRLGSGEPVLIEAADALASIRAELAEALADKARVDELLTAAVDDYNETLAERDMAERAAVEAAIPLEALLMAGQGPLSDAVWDGVRNGVGHVRSMLKARAARTIAGEQTNVE